MKPSPHIESDILQIVAGLEFYKKKGLAKKNDLPKILVCNFTLRASQPLQYANLLIQSNLELFVLSVSFRVVLEVA